jgi:hypothetical protein
MGPFFVSYHSVPFLYFIILEIGQALAIFF